MYKVFVRSADNSTLYQPSSQPSDQHSILRPVPKLVSFTTITAAACVLVFIITQIVYLSKSGQYSWPQVLVDFGALYGPYIKEKHQYWRMLTEIYLHFDLRHLFTNMASLLLLGFQLEREFGASAYAMIYLAAGIMGNLTSLCFLFNSLSVGASGAICGLFGLSLTFIYDNLSEIQNKNSIKMSVGINLLLLVIGSFGQGINYYAHFGGFAAGILLGVLYMKKKPEEKLLGNVSMSMSRKLSKGVLGLSVISAMIYIYVKHIRQPTS